MAQNEDLPPYAPPSDTKHDSVTEKHGIPPLPEYGYTAYEIPGPQERSDGEETRDGHNETRISPHTPLAPNRGTA